MTGSQDLGRRSIKGAIFLFFRNIFFSSRGFPIFLTCTILAVLFVLYRMRSVEIDYEINKVNKNIREARLEHKQLKAMKAKLLSVKKLRNLAKKYDLDEPKEKQIIMIP